MVEVKDPPPYHGSGTVIASSHAQIVDGPPPSYDSIFKILQAQREASDDVVDYAKNVSGTVDKTCGGVCCTIIGVIIITAFLFALPIAEIAIGAQNLKACPAQDYLSIYLIVGGVFGVLHGFSQCGSKVSKRRIAEDEEAEEGTGAKANNCCGGLVGLFVFCWFICGNVWVFQMERCEGPIPNTTSNCFTTDAVYSNSSLYCEKILYDFTFWETVAKWILVGVLMLLGCLGCCFACCVFACCGGREEEEAVNGA